MHPSSDSDALRFDAAIAVRGSSPYPKKPECCEAGCWRPVYGDDRCKAHRDLYHYIQMRILERRCTPGLRVRCRTNKGEYVDGVACSIVRIETVRVAEVTKARTTVLVQLKGHHIPYNWPAVDVEVA